MENNSANQETTHVIKNWEVNKDRVATMHHRITEPPKLLSNAAGKSSCCIFRVPQSLIEVNGKSYQPHIVSIGPYHHNQPQFKLIDEHKWQYLGSLLSRTQTKKGIGLEHFLQSIAELEVEARECYSETIHLNTDDFVEMMVLDGCFIIELFRKAANLVRFEPTDPLVTMAWIIPFMYRDFLRLENQIPFFILERLFELSKLEEEEEEKLSNCPSLCCLALQFFNNAMQRPDEAIERHSNLRGCKHLLDLVRSSLIPKETQENIKGNTPTHIIHCVSKLRRAGIKLKKGKVDTFLDIRFKKNGVIEMPTIIVDDFMSSFLQNCVAFEQCHSTCSKHFTTFAIFMDCLVNTYKDVEYLCDRDIIENCFGNDGEVARFINNLGKDVAYDIDNQCYMSQLFNDVHDYYKDSWHVQLASFKYTYFDTPWSFISACAAFILLLLTLAQTFYTIVSYYHPLN